MVLDGSSDCDGQGTDPGDPRVREDGAFDDDICRDGEGAVLDDEGVKRELVVLVPRLRRFALSLCGSRADADDLVQTALERALTRLHQWQRGTRLDSWMYRIVRNARIDEVRAQQVRPVSVSLDAVAHRSEMIGDSGDHEARITVERVLVALQQLSEPHRAVMTLICVEGLRYREAADVLDITVGTVMSRLSRARRRIHELMHGQDHEAGQEKGNGH